MLCYIVNFLIVGFSTFQHTSASYWNEGEGYYKRKMSQKPVCVRWCLCSVVNIRLGIVKFSCWKD
jgi:hypothetical protein